MGPSTLWIVHAGLSAKQARLRQTLAEGLGCSAVAILAEGAIALSVTLSGGALFAS